MTKIPSIYFEDFFDENAKTFENNLWSDPLDRFFLESKPTNSDTY